MGAVFHFQVTIGVDKTVEELQREFDDVVLGIGAEKENLASLATGDGVESGLVFLRRLNLEKGRYLNEYRALKSDHFVWGGGNVALDCARLAKRLLGKSPFRSGNARIQRRNRSGQKRRDSFPVP